MLEADVEKGPGEFYVIGLSLPEQCLQQLSIAFPHFIKRKPLTNTCEQISTLCAFLGNVVIFNYMPAMLPHMFLRTSAIFDRRSVFTVGVHPDSSDKIYDIALNCEFDGVLEADSDAEQYVRVAHSVRTGELWFPRTYLSQRTREYMFNSSPHALSQREADILNLLAYDHTNQSIADSLCVSRDTVRWHLRSIYTKLGVSDRKAAVCVAKNNMAGTNGTTFFAQNAGFVPSGMA